MNSSEVHAISLAEQSAQSPVKQEELEQGAYPPPMPCEDTLRLKEEHEGGC